MAQVKLTDLLEEQSNLISREAVLRANLGGWGVGDTPFKKVRVVTTVDFALD